MDSCVKSPHRKKLKVLEPALISLVVYGIYCLVASAVLSCGRALDGTSAHLISQLDQAIGSHYTDYARYPLGDGSGSCGLVGALSKPGPKKVKYFEFPVDILERPSIHADPRENILSALGKPIYYRCPGIHNPQKFDLWTE